MLITATSDSKVAMTVTSPAAGVLAPGATELVLWVGATVSSDMEAVAAAKRCLDSLREIQTPGAAYGAESPVGAAKSSVLVAAGAPTVTDNDVAIAYGASLNVDGTTITPIVTRAIEKYLEARKAA